MCGGLQIRQNGEDETETLKRRSRNGGRRNGALFVFIRPPFPATMLCGVADCTFRKVFEYSAESTRVLAAEYVAGLRTALRYFAQDTNTNKHRSGGFPDVAGTELPRTGTTPVRGSFSWPRP